MGRGNATEVKMRSFAEIIAAEKSERNILDMSYDELGEFIFDILKINPDDCMGFGFNTGRYYTREIKFRPGVDLSPCES